MSEFKVGDKVRLLENSYSRAFPNQEAHKPGKVGTVVKVYESEGNVDVEVTSGSNIIPMYFYKTEVEAVDESEAGAADEHDVAIMLRLMGVDVTDEQMETAVDLAITLQAARDEQEATNE